jgi:hypothetical protein
LFNRYERLCELLKLKIESPFEIEAEDPTIYGTKPFRISNDGFQRLTLVVDSKTGSDFVWKELNPRVSEDLIIDLIVGSVKATPVLDLLSYKIQNKLKEKYGDESKVN